MQPHPRPHPPPKQSQKQHAYRLQPIGNTGKTEIWSFTISLAGNCMPHHCNQAWDVQTYPALQKPPTPIHYTMTTCQPLPQKSPKSQQTFTLSKALCKPATVCKAHQCNNSGRKSSKTMPPQFSWGKHQGTLPEEENMERQKSFFTQEHFQSSSGPTRWWESVVLLGSDSLTNSWRMGRLSQAKGLGAAPPSLSPRKSPVNTGLWWTSDA